VAGDKRFEGVCKLGSARGAVTSEWDRAKADDDFAD
jgi:hypothetical protein